MKRESAALLHRFATRSSAGPRCGRILRLLRDAGRVHDRERWAVDVIRMLVGFHQWLQKRSVPSTPRAFNSGASTRCVLANRIIRIREVSARKRNDRGERKRRRNLRRISGAVGSLEKLGYFDSSLPLVTAR